MLLQKMRYKNSDTQRPRTVVCAVNGAQNGMEFTMCGSAIPDSNMAVDGFQCVGDFYVGKYKDVTCQDCRKMIDYMLNAVKSEDV